jgi:hypothetical protein
VSEVHFGQVLILDRRQASIRLINTSGRQDYGAQSHHSGQTKQTPFRTDQPGPVRKLHQRGAVQAETGIQAYGRRLKVFGLSLTTKHHRLYSVQLELSIQMQEFTGKRSGLSDLASEALMGHWEVAEVRS